MFALVDCNNFYASCERLFKPHLNDKPIIVLSNNDGCVIARSNEAKALGIKMGQPYFEVQRICEANKVFTFSSNYTLYGDISNRVMSVLESCWPEVEVYSIDEAFLYLKGLPQSHIENFSINLHKQVLQWTGIPVSIGIGKTKTLAKLANHIAKRVIKKPFLNITDNEHHLKKLAIDDVWGIGRRLSKQLLNMGIETPWQLSQTNAHLMRKKFNLMVMRTILELQGTSCIPLEEVAPAKKGIMSSRSFGTMLTSFNDISQALSHFCARASKKLRKQDSYAGKISVFIRTNPFRKDLAQYNCSTFVNLVHPTSDVRQITKWANICLKQIYREGYHYKKVGVYLDNLKEECFSQGDLLNPEPFQISEQSKQVMTVLDAINGKFGQGVLRTASEGFSKEWGMKQSRRSPCYTTNWDELPIATIR